MHSVGSDPTPRVPAPGRGALAAAVLVALAGACASSSRQAGPDETPIASGQSARVVVPGSGSTTHMETRAVNEDYLRTTSVAAPADRVWLAVAGAYDDLKLPITTRVDASRQVASQGRRFRGSIGGTRLGILFNCGSSAAGGDLADSYELTVDVASTVAPAADAAQSTVQSVVSALARPVMTSGEPVRCASTGRLEQKIVEAASKRLQR